MLVFRIKIGEDIRILFQNKQEQNTKGSNSLEMKIIKYIERDYRDYFKKSSQPNPGVLWNLEKIFGTTPNKVE